MDWMFEAASTLDRAGDQVARSFETIKHRALRLLAAGDAAAASAATSDSTRLNATLTSLTDAHLEAARAITEGLKRAQAGILNELSSAQAQLSAARRAARRVATAPPAYGPAPVDSEFLFTWVPARTWSGGAAAADYDLFAPNITADAVHERAGADHAMAGALAALAEHRPAALQLLLAQPEEPGAQGMTLHLPGLDPIAVEPTFPEYEGRAGIVSENLFSFGVEFIAKGYAMAQASQRVPWLDPATHPVSARSRLAVETLTGLPAFEQDTRLFDDESVLDEVRQADFVIACTDAIDEGHPHYDLASDRHLITGREQAYAVRGADDEDRIALYHPLGYSITVSAPDFRTLFPRLVVGTAPETPETVPPTAQQLEHLAAHLQG